MRSLVLWSSFLLLVPGVASAQSPPALTIVSAGPTGELSALAEANEIRVVFSEPMVVLGRIPQPVQAPFFSVSPAIRGSFRWSGTTILIFTPAATDRPPYAARYTVTIDASATAVSGRRLATPHTFSFVTPTTKLRSTTFYRLDRRVDRPLVIALRFNQPVTRADIAAHTTLRFEPHGIGEPRMTPRALARLQRAEPQALARFEARVAAAQRDAMASTPVTFRLAPTWDTKRFPDKPDLVVLETTSRVPPGGWVRVELDGALPSPAGRATPNVVQHYVAQVAPAFFMLPFMCAEGCDPDRYNPLRMSVPVALADLRTHVTVTDITDPAREVVVQPIATPPAAGAQRRRRGYLSEEDHLVSLEDLGYAAQPPARTYAIRVDPALRSADGQTLGYPWMAIVENWHQAAFTSFGDGHGVWEADGGAQLPFYARNFQRVMQWAAPIAPSALMPALLQLQDKQFKIAPPTAGVERTLAVKPDTIQSFGLDLSGALNAASRGLVWGAVKEGAPIARATPASTVPVKATVVQVTNLGITVKDSPQNTLVFVTRLDTGEPVAAATVSIVDTKNQTFWRGTTDADGLALAPDTRLRDPRRPWRFSFIVTAEKDGDVAYVGSDWQEGIQPWQFGLWTDLFQADPVLRGSVFTDRGVYKLGEELHVKAILRHDTTSGIRLLPPDTPVAITLRDSQNREIDTRTVTMNAWSSAEWSMRVPQNGPLGNYSIEAKVSRERKDEDKARDGEGDNEDWNEYRTQHDRISGGFLVAAYRRPEFRVDSTLTSANAIAGTSLKGVVTGRYLFGAAMRARPLRWTVRRSPAPWAPVAGIRKGFSDDRFEFTCFHPGCGGSPEPVSGQEASLDAKGEHAVDVAVPIDLGQPYTYTLEGDVEDLSRQRIAGSASFLVHPAPWYIGLLRPSSFVSQAKGLETAVVTVSPDGAIAPGVAVVLRLVQRQWHSVRRAEGNGFYTWDVTEREVEHGQWSVTTADKPVPLSIALKSGGSFTLIATAKDGSGRSTTTKIAFYVLGEGYTAWRRYDHQRIDLVPERSTYKPGDTARIMIQSPWERATALVTTEREGIRSQRRFMLTSTQQTIDVPIAEADIPNVFVSVLLVKGRSKPDASSAKTGGAGASVPEDGSDPGKPAFRLGYVRLDVEDASKKLTVRVKANKEEFRPAGTAKVEVDVSDAAGKPARSEVTLWAVDYGVLSLTAFRTPDVLKSVYVDKALQVFTTDNRQRVVSRRVLTPKGASEGGGGGEDDGVSSVRKDFKVLAFWLGSVVTDDKGRAKTEVKLPESLTTYRIMAVSGDKLSRFGSGDSEIRINKPVLLRAAFPRFLAVGDSAFFGSVITNQLREGGTATVTMRSLDPGVLAIAGEREQRVTIAGGGSAEVRFSGAARSVGRARLQMTVRLRGESDAFEEIVPVEILSSPETVAAYGEVGIDAGRAADPTDAANRAPAAHDTAKAVDTAKSDAAGTEGANTGGPNTGGATRAEARERLAMPSGVVPGFGGLHLELSSTAMVGLGEGARYLVEYPYGCAEQRGSRALALLLTADLGQAFSLPGILAKDLRPRVQAALKELETFQCPNGGFAYWPGACESTSPYLTAYLLHVFHVAATLKYDVDSGMQARAYTYLERALAGPPAVNEGWWPAYTAWQAFAVKVLVEGGRQQDSHVTRLHGYLDRMPIFAMAYLYDAMTARGERGPRIDEVRRRILNGVLPEGGSAHVEELSDPHLLWFWSSNVRSTAIVLGSLVRNADDRTHIRSFVRWLMTVRKKGRWGNTQENALALEALVAYYRKYERDVPDFTAVVTLGPNELTRETFAGRTTTAIVRDVPMRDLSARIAPGATQDLTFARQGTGTLFYSTRLRYAVDALVQDSMDNGFRVERRYARLGEDGKTGTPGLAATPATAFKAGDLIEVTLSFSLTKERRFVAVTDPLPAGFEPIESWFSTTAAELARRQDQQRNEDGSDRNWTDWWQRGGFDHIERHDDRVQIFATRLSEGTHTFSYIVRATTAGTFRTAPAHVEEMYEPEVFGRTATTTIEVQR